MGRNEGSPNPAGSDIELRRITYVTTPKHMQEAPAYATEADTVIIAYKPAETVRVAEMEAVTETGADIRFAEVADRDDLLVFLGAVLAQGDMEFVFLDPTLPVPKRFAGNVKTTGKKTVRRKTAQKKNDAEETVKKEENLKTAEKKAPVKKASTESTPAGEKKPAPRRKKAEKTAEKPSSGIEESGIGMNKPEPPEDTETAEKKENPVKKKTSAGKNKMKKEETPAEKGEFSGAKAFWEKAREKCGIDS